MFEIGRLDVSSKVLISANALVILLALIFKFSIAIIAWTYLIEGIIIVLLTSAKMFVESIKIEKYEYSFKLPLQSMVTPIYFGIFLFGYVLFLLAYDIFALNISDYINLFLASGIFLLSHIFSFYFNVLKKELEIKEVKRLETEADKMVVSMFFRRIIPIQLTMGIAFLAIEVLQLTEQNVKLAVMILFMGVKTYWDLKGHQKKHHLIEKV